MQHSGWIKLHRSLCENELWQAEKFNRGQAWIDLLLMANHKPGSIRKRGVHVKVPIGAIGHSQRVLAERWQWSRGKVIRFLNELESLGMIVPQKNNVTTLIHIKNYSKYQNTTPQTEPQTEPQIVPEQEVKNEKKKRVGTFGNVFLSEEEITKLKNKFNSHCDFKINALSEYMKSKGKKYKDHYATILAWDRKDRKNQPKKEKLGGYTF